jgi:hypothetical protein
MLLVAQGVQQKFGQDLALPWYRLASANGNLEAEEFLRDVEQEYEDDDDYEDDEEDEQPPADLGPRFCTNCGTAREGSSKFCTNCGTAIA